MIEIFDFFARNYPSIIPILTGAFVSFFIVWFYLKISNQMTGLGKEMVSLDKKIVSLGKEMVRLDKKMDDRFAKGYEQFLEFRKEMNEGAAKSDEGFENIIEKMDERFMNLIEKMWMSSSPK